MTVGAGEIAPRVLRPARARLSADRLWAAYDARLDCRQPPAWRHPAESPRAGRQQGQAGSVGYAGGPFVHACAVPGRARRDRPTSGARRPVEVSGPLVRVQRWSHPSRCTAATGPRRSPR